MGIRRARFHETTDRSNGDELSYYLARDELTGEVFVLQRRADRQFVSEESATIHEFLSMEGEAQQALVALIGTLTETGYD